MEVTLKELIEALGKNSSSGKECSCMGGSGDKHASNPFIGKLCVIRTYSAGVHVGKLESVNPENAHELQLSGAWRLWKWENGGLSLSAIARHGIKGGRTNYTGDIYLTDAIEIIPTTQAVIDSLRKFEEDKDE